MNRRMLTMAAACTLAMGCHGAGRRAGLSDPDHQDDHLVRRRRRLRHHRPHHRAAHAGEARPDRRGREPARRRRPARQRGDRQFAEGRLHARRPDRRPDHRLGDDQEHALRRGRGVRLDRADRDRRPAHRGAAGLALQGHQVAGRRRQGRTRARSCSPARAIGATQHLAAELFKQVAGINMLHVPYRTSPEALAALLSQATSTCCSTP